jgi:hypothetical protein
VAVTGLRTLFGVDGAQSGMGEGYLLATFDFRFLRDIPCILLSRRVIGYSVFRMTVDSQCMVSKRSDIDD